MKLIRHAVAVLVCLAMSAGSATAKVHDITYDESNNGFYVDEHGATGKPDYAGSMELSFDESDVLALHVHRTIPGLLVPNAVRVDLKGAGLTSVDLSRLGIPIPGSSEIPNNQDVEVTGPTPADKYAALRAAIAGVQEAVDTDLGKYQDAHAIFRSRLSDLLDVFKLKDQERKSPVEIEKAMGANQLTSDDPEFGTDILALDAAGTLGDAAPSSFELDTPGTITITFKSTNRLITAPSTAAVVYLRGSSGWRLSSSTGFGFSGLIDDHFTSTVVVDAAASGSTPAVTHREAVGQPRDGFSPDAVFFVHAYNLNAPRLRIWPTNAHLPLKLLAPTFGVGVNTGGTNGRFFGGLALRLGLPASITAGWAGGKVKRLSKSVDPHNLGDQTDPEASRIDVFRSSWFLAFSWRVST